MRKSGCVSKPRLSRLRKVPIRPLEPNDVKYVWAAYRKDRSSLSDLFPDLAQENIDPKIFRTGFLDFVKHNYDAWWTIGEIPYGLAVAELPAHGRVMFIVNMIWYPWATDRNILEGSVSFINQARKETKVYGFVQMKDVGFWNHVCRYGIMRRVGTSYELYADGSQAAVYESKRLKKWAEF